VAPLTIGGMSMSVQGVPVDLVAPVAMWVQEALQDVQNYTLSKPYLVLTKLWASRGEQDDADVIALLRASGHGELDIIRGVIQRHLPDQVDDLEQMIEISRMASGSQG